MTIDEAIKVLQGTATQDLKREFSDIYDAHQLGIEALKRLQYRRGFGIPADLKLLPGETKD